ncbi:MAG: hypothetical protein M1503_09865 [Thaumarchaeota archaeon]|nr:hypothetical protein [Nitrososphaerota archaeon]
MTSYLYPTIPSKTQVTCLKTFSTTEPSLKAGSTTEIIGKLAFEDIDNPTDIYSYTLNQEKYTLHTGNAVDLHLTQDPRIEAFKLCEIRFRQILWTYVRKPPLSCHSNFRASF